MEEYVANPPVFKAEQWDGTPEHAMRLFNAIKVHTGRIFAKIEVEVGDDGETHMIPEFETQRNERWRMRKDYWVVLDPQGGASTMSDDAFKSAYSKNGDS